MTARVTARVRGAEGERGECVVRVSVRGTVRGGNDHEVSVKGEGEGEVRVRVRVRKRARVRARGKGGCGVGRG